MKTETFAERAKRIYARFTVRMGMRPDWDNLSRKEKNAWIIAAATK